MIFFALWERCHGDCGSPDPHPSARACVGEWVVVLTSVSSPQHSCAVLILLSHTQCLYVVDARPGVHEYSDLIALSFTYAILFSLHTLHDILEYISFDTSSFDNICGIMLIVNL